MKFLLSSDEKAAALGMKLLVNDLNGLKVLWVVTASKKKLNINYLNPTLQYFLELNCKPTIFDISDNSEEDLRNLVKDFDLIFVGGGDTFYLMDEIRKTGFDKILNEWIRIKPYVGVSAGSYIMQPTIEVPTWYHPKEEWEYLKDLSGIKAVDFFFLVHAQKKDIEPIANRAKKEGKELLILNDSEALLIEDEKVEKLKLY